MTLAKTELFTKEQVRLAQFARSLSHPARIAIVGLLLDQESMTCQQIVDALPLAQSTVSQHLKAMRQTGLIAAQPCGTQVCYSLVTDQIQDFCRGFRQSLGNPE